MTLLNADLSTHHRVVEGTLLIDLGIRMRVLSSAPKGGGLRTTRYILNHQVVPSPVKKKTSRANVSPLRWEDPARYLRRIALDLGADGDCVGLMTAVPMKQLVTGREAKEGIWVECYATVGVTNAVQAGEPPSRAIGQGKDRTAGTINLILITNACLSASALVGAVQVATESKTALLRDHAVPSWTGRPGATGTGTDAVVVACALQGQGPWTPYAGTHTEIGSMIGRVTADCLFQGLARATRWSRRLPP
ncbi:MAG TPA: adenosylcobinamide amidohydrolase [Nitrospira sp.]|jgi:iron complex transport system ATP-binding protein|nr:adenosylcobinamide amidohydrolase [Nitrospira sp.]